MADLRWFFHSCTRHQLLYSLVAIPCTQVIQAPLSFPKAICQAGSRDWKYSSGWKKVLTLSALRILNATRNKKMSCDVDTCLTRSTARRRRPLTSSRLIELSRPNLVEACDIGVVGGDDMAKHLLRANASDWENPVLRPRNGRLAVPRPDQTRRPEAGRFCPTRKAEKA